MPKFTRSFITGSWAYGSPRLHEHEDNMCEECDGEGCENCRSDIDLVTLVSKEDFEMRLIVCGERIKVQRHQVHQDVLLNIPEVLSDEFEDIAMNFQH